MRREGVKARERDCSDKDEGVAEAIGKQLVRRERMRGVCSTYS